jgi:hypothetical protein
MDADACPELLVVLLTKLCHGLVEVEGKGHCIKWKLEEEHQTLNGLDLMAAIICQQLSRQPQLSCTDLGQAPGTESLGELALLGNVEYQQGSEHWAAHLSLRLLPHYQGVMNRQKVSLRRGSPVPVLRAFAALEKPVVSDLPDSFDTLSGFLIDSRFYW